LRPIGFEGRDILKNPLGGLDPGPMFREGRIVGGRVNINLKGNLEITQWSPAKVGMGSGSLGVKDDNRDGPNLVGLPRVNLDPGEGGGVSLERGEDRLLGDGSDSV
jgi:hypothetical protein